MNLPEHTLPPCRPNQATKAFRRIRDNVYRPVRLKTVSTTVVSNGGGGGGCTKSLVGMFPASVVTETIPVRATAIKKRFIRLSLLKVFGGYKNTCIKNTKPSI